MLAADPQIIYCNICHSHETHGFRHELEVSSMNQQAPAGQGILYIKKHYSGELLGPLPPTAFIGGKDARYPLNERRGCRNGVG